MLYDTYDPYKWELKSKIDQPAIRQIVTDMDITASEKYMVFSTLSSTAHMLEIGNLGQQRGHQWLHFGPRDGPAGADRLGHLMSVKFSSDGKELVSGNKGGTLAIFDIFADKVSSETKVAHSEVINSVCFAGSSANLIYTASDDALIKVWDKRALNTVAGAFVGHLEGATHVASNANELHLASNSKD